MAVRVTIDSSVVHSRFKPSEADHADAVALLAAAERGDVQLVIAAQGSAIDLPGGPLADRLRDLIDSGLVERPPQIDRFGPATVFGSDLKFGHHVDGFWEAWRAEVKSWPTHKSAPPNREDYWHVESHLLSDAAVFITADGDVLDMCARLARHGHKINAMKLGDFMASRASAS